MVHSPKVLRIPFQLAPGQAFSSLDGEVSRQHKTLTIRLSSDPGSNHSLLVEPLACEADAASLIPKLYAGLLWAALHEGISPTAQLDVRDVAYSADPEQAARNMFPSGSRARIHGTIDGSYPAVYDIGKSIAIFSGQPASITIGYNPGRTLDRLCEALSFTHPERAVIDNKLRVALDLYNAFVRESSQNARFLTLALALEALLLEEKKPEYAIRMIDCWLGEVNDKRSVAKLDSEEAAVYESLKGGLEFQKNVSINSKVRILVGETLARHGDKDASEVAARAVKLYGRRSILVHTGFLPVEELTESTAELKSIMQRVLTARFIEVTGRARD